jgi:hypothetical protein
MLVNTGFCVYLAVRSNEGKWARYPLVGSLAMRFIGNSRFARSRTHPAPPFYERSGDT